MDKLAAETPAAIFPADPAWVASSGECRGFSAPARNLDSAGMTSHIFRLLFEFTGPCIWRETRVVRILDGTSEIMRQIIARNAFGNRERRNAPI
ncbi:acyl-CoA dehydrogenase family protein [Bradyrhizobium sp. USDA 4473]